jgi:hypothetical protein
VANPRVRIGNARTSCFPPAFAAHKEVGRNSERIVGKHGSYLSSRNWHSDWPAVINSRDTAFWQIGLGNGRSGCLRRFRAFGVSKSRWS